jgi:23S rRNA pseudouridine1911/1915/1917 synthase
MESPPPEILYEDGPCLVVYKPTGLLTQAPPGIDSIETRIKNLIRRRRNVDGNVYLGVPHRLDRPASGVMVFALHSRATRRLSEQFEARTVRKTYWAITEGIVEPASGRWSDAIRKIPGEARSEIVDAEHPEGRTAVLNFTTLGQTSAGSWLEIELETGRTHQVRVQAASRGRPLLGDEPYGATTMIGEQFDDVRLRAIALHARRLEFFHPTTQQPVAVEAPPPEAWGEFLQPFA